MNKKEICLSVGIPIVLVFITVMIIVFKKDINHFVKSTRKMVSGEKTASGSENIKKSGRAKSVRKKGRKRVAKVWKSTDDEDREVREIYASLQQPLTDNERLDLLADLFGSTNPLILDIVSRELDNPNEEVRLDALDLLSEFQNEDIFDNLSKALDDKSAEVREAAIDILNDVDIKGGSNYEVDLLTKGVNDKSEDVRDAALSVLGDKPLFELETIAESAISSKYPDVKEEILSNLALNPSMNGIEIMITGLRDEDKDFREDVQFELEVITDQEFNSYEAAKDWWDKNKFRFEEEFENDDDDE
jgi:HEAT repeat protein